MKGKILPEAEKRRLEGFEKTSDEMIRQGCVRHNLTIDIGKASKFGLLLLIPLFIHRVLPMIAGITVGNLDVLFIGIMMADAAAGIF